MSYPLTTDFNGQEGSLSFWVQCISTDANTQPFDYSLFHLQATVAGNQFKLDVRIPDAGEAKPDALTVDYGQIGGTVKTITDTNFISTDWQNIAVTWSYATGGHQLKYYKNGTLVSTSSDCPQWTAGAPTAFEATIGPANHNMSHMAVWDTPLPASDIAYVYAKGSAQDSVTMDIDRGAFGSVVRFYNPTSFRCYVTSLNIKGKRIKRYRAARAESTNETSRSRYGQSSLDWDMPYETDPVFASLFANWMLGKVASPSSQIESITFHANASSAVFKQALALEPGDRIAVQEDQTGLNASFHVAGVDYQLSGQDALRVTLYVVSADQTASWNAGVAGFSEAGTTTFAAL